MMGLASTVGGESGKSTNLLHTATQWSVWLGRFIVCYRRGGIIESQ